MHLPESFDFHLEILCCVFFCFLCLICFFLNNNEKRDGQKRIYLQKDKSSRKYGARFICVCKTTNYLKKKHSKIAKSKEWNSNRDIIGMREK